MKGLFLGALAIAAAGIAAASPAGAADNVMKVCGAKYQAAKAGKTLPAGQTWNQYLAACRAAQPKTVAAAPAPAAIAAKPAAPSAATPAKPGWTAMFHKPATAAPAAPAAHPAPAAPASAVATKPAGTQSAGMMAAHDRQRQCGAQWKADKAAGKTPTGQTWPQYWSACNKRLKG